MPQRIIKSYKALMDEADAGVQSISADRAVILHSDPHTIIIDIRDIRELEREGRIPQSFHAPRGMLEFWVDPDSPYHKPIFAKDKTFVICCASGWRSLLATQTLQTMGLHPVLNLRGGFAAWKEAGGKIEALEKKS